MSTGNASGSSDIIQRHKEYYIIKNIFGNVDLYCKYNGRVAVIQTSIHFTLERLFVRYNIIQVPIY